jgi:phage terminase small subunit
VKETPKKAKFARLWRELGNASEAYRQSYNVSADTKPETVWDSACKLLQDPWVAQRIMELEKEARALHLVTVESLTTELENAREQAERLKQPSAQTSAILGKARLNGIGVDKKHVTLETSDRMLEILNGIDA